MSGKKYLFGTGVSMLNQAWLSGLNFLIGIVFIRYAPKEDYGVYLQLFAILMLTVSVHGALFYGPLVALAPKTDPQDANRLIVHQGVFQALLATVVALLVVLAIPAIGELTGLSALSIPMAIVFGLWVIATWQREYLRYIAFLNHQAERAALIDLIYGLALLAGLGLMLASESISLYTVVAVLAFANFSALLWRGSRQLGWRQVLADSVPLAHTLKRAWELARWTLPGVVVTWVYSNAYLYVSAALLSAADTADLGASRLLLMPIVILLTGWQNVFIPKASHWLGQKNYPLMLRVCLSSMAGILLCTAVFVVALWLAFPLIRDLLLGEKYDHVLNYVAAWAVYFSVRCVSVSGVSIIMAGGLFKELFNYSMISMIVGITAIIFGTWQFGAIGAIVGLAITECINAILIWTRGLPLVRQAQGVGQARTSL